MLVTSSFPIKSDGSEAAGSFVADLVNELSLWTSVRVVAPGPAMAREQWSEMVEVFRYASPTKPLSTLKVWNPLDAGWIMRVLSGGQDATLAAANGAAHVLALWGLPCGVWAKRAASRYGLSYSVWLLGSDVWSLGRIPILRNILAKVIRKARNVWADGYLLASDAQAIANASVGFLPSTRSIERRGEVQPRHTPPYRLLFLGRWHVNKGVDLLLNALDLLSEEDWSLIASVEIQGGGPLDALVRSRVESLRGKSRPVGAGRFLDKKEAEDAIDGCDWVLLPSRIESIPVIFSDAMKLGRPVISMPVGDLPVLISRYDCGLNSPTLDAAGFAKTLHLALRTDANIYAVNTKAVADLFSLPRIVQTLLTSHG